MVTWVRVDDEMPQHAVLSGPNLFINNLNKTDNGTYRCEASNIVGKAHSDYMLYVYGTCKDKTLPLPDSFTCSRCLQITLRAFGQVENRKPVCFLQKLKEAWPEVDPSVSTWEGSDFSSLPLIAGLSC